MNLESRFPYTESQELGGAQVLELPYKMGETSMVVILPHKQSGLRALESSLTPATLDGVLKKLPQRSSHKVKVFLPKFKVNTKYELTNTLKAMGIKAAFSNADFSGISRQGNLVISEVIQKVFVEVDEKGTEAAAVTGV